MKHARSTFLVLTVFCAAGACVPKQYAAVQCVDRSNEIEEFWHYSSKLELQLAFVKAGVPQADSKAERIISEVDDVINTLVDENELMCDKCTKKQSLPHEECNARTHCHMAILNWLKIYLNLIKGADRDVIRYSSRGLEEITQRLSRCEDPHFYSVYLDDVNVQDRKKLWKSERKAAKAFFLQTVMQKETAAGLRDRRRNLLRKFPQAELWLTCSSQKQNWRGRNMICRSQRKNSTRFSKSTGN